MWLPIRGYRCKIAEKRAAAPFTKASRTKKGGKIL